MSESLIVGLVACAKTKRPGLLPAAEKYASPLFVKSLAAARAECAQVFILSAKHGLLAIDTMVADYDQALAELPKHTRAIWAAGVRDGLRARFGGKPVEFRAWAGKLYVSAVRCSTHGQEWTVAEPLKGLQVGQRLQTLNQPRTVRCEFCQYDVAASTGSAAMAKVHCSDTGRSVGRVICEGSYTAATVARVA